MNVKLKKLSIHHFKGIKDFSCNFIQTTNIYGDNATGKTTILDAFLWLFFGKNSEDATQFEIKPLDEHNHFIKNLEAEVEAIILVDQQEIAVRKVLRQKWVRKRGELQANYSGDENIYFWNDVPCKESEFKVKIKQIVDENLFRLITNPFYFNSLKWNERRNILIDMAGEITNQEVMNKISGDILKRQYDQLITALNGGKTIVEFQKELAVKKKKIKEEKEMIPSRIDEVMRSLPMDMNYVQLRTDLHELEDQLAEVELQINDDMAKQKAANVERAEILNQYNNQLQAKAQKIFDIKSQLRDLEFEAQHAASRSSSEIGAQMNSLNRQLNDKIAERERSKNALERAEAMIQAREAELTRLRNEYVQVDEEQLPSMEDSCVCPTCRQQLPAADIANRKTTLTENYNKSKVAKLSAIVANATAIKEDIRILSDNSFELNVAITNANSSVTMLMNQLDKLQRIIDQEESVVLIKDRMLQTNTAYQSLLTEMAALEGTVIEAPVLPMMVANEQLAMQRSELAIAIADLNRELNNELVAERAKMRKGELERQEAQLAQDLADLEGVEYAITQFNKAKVTEIERRINSKFQYVKFKMFNQQINGGEVETCESLINTNGSWVPYSDANNAARINAGIDIINTLTSHYNVNAPVFIDNRESVTKLIDSSSQIVNLIVSEKDKHLRVA